MNRKFFEGCTPAPHFIGAWQLAEEALMDEVIELFEANPQRHRPGMISAGQNETLKNSADMTIHPRDLQVKEFDPMRRYVDLLADCFRDYAQQWPFVAHQLEPLEMGSFNLQKYGVGQHFSHVHSERTELQTAHRLFAWMTYLSDVDGGGETEFVHFDLSVRPLKGLTLLWPAEWTHAHRGQPVLRGEKYIVTGWMHFPAKSGQSPVAEKPEP